MCKEIKMSKPSVTFGVEINNFAGLAKYFEVNAEVRPLLKVGYAARLVPTELYHHAALKINQAPKVGDLFLAKVKKIGRHTRLDDQNGRRILLLEGDIIVGVYGNRYATDQFEGEVPQSTEVCQLLSVAGVSGVVKSRHSAMKQPTELDFIGFLYDQTNRQLNLRDFGIPITSKAVPAKHGFKHPKVLIVTGSAMNSGKTTTVAHLVQGLARKGFKVAAGKITGTACGNDVWDYQDNGAIKAMDFSDLGFPSTYLCSETELIQIYRTLYHELSKIDPDYIVMEIADGVVQRETVMLLANAEFKQSLDHLLYAAGDSLAAEAVYRQLILRDYQPLAFSGLVSASPLAIREAEKLTGLRCYTREELSEGAILPLLKKSAGGKTEQLAGMLNQNWLMPTNPRLQVI
jgi:hypothetical protein